MTRAITLAALTCFLLAGAAITAILGRDSLPAAQADVGPVANRASKQDKLAVTTLATAAFEVPQPAAPPASPSPLLLRAQAAIPGATDTVRQAYASAEPADIGLPQITDPVDAAQPKIAEPAPAPVAAAPKPKAAAKPAPQKNYALLSDAQIAGIKDRLKLSSSQEYYWPAVETALRAVARKIHAKRQGDPAAGNMPIDPDSEEVQQLKSAAMPLLFQLREDQKNEVRSLARLIGLERVASMI
ncbi:hypothetical protein H8A95_03595 [Bradyrhizobium sp. Pear76]|uniref:hypothetical protein n=1 Tax=Bradyrhizobium oropedii TaxID=1571201 RepID=UPI001E453159|nr:hypothetical protein [Bradyrhizobium oropedii]MCC8961425.1 hypothetical protein [Bradyrhizobium oropedii]